MIDLKVLEAHGCTNARIREIFTATDVESPDYALREKLEEEIETRVHEGIESSCQNHSLYLAVDIAWDSNPITKEVIPLLLYAQGKIDMKSCVADLENLECAAEFCERDKETNEVKAVNLPRLYEVSVNLVRSYVTRRLASQSARFSNLWPYFKYEPRVGSGVVGKVKAEALSQRMEVMADQFNYRHFFTQTIRDQLLYGKSLVFPVSGWTVEKQWHRKERDEAFGGDTVGSYTAKVIREGVDFINPHPTRLFWDNAYPLPNINTDTGPRFVGYWDVVRYRDIEDDPSFFNRDRVVYSDQLFGINNQYSTFFDYYYDPTALRFPSRKSDYAMANNRTATIGKYSGDTRDNAVFLTQYYTKVNPKRLGISDYPYDVWMHLTVASDNTVIWGEFLPSFPAVYGGINENDSRMANLSMAHEIMPFQDQMTNILSQMLRDMKSAMFQIWMLNEDVLTDEMKEYIKRAMEAGDWYVDPKMLFFSGRSAEDLGLNVDQAIKMVEIDAGKRINQAFSAINQLLGLVERLLILSPQELGQPAPREISATEVAAIANTTDSIYSFISDGIDEQRAGVKKLLYESFVNCGQESFTLPVTNRYTEQTVQEAGLTPAEQGTSGKGMAVQSVMGTPRNLVHDYIFSSRDGAERVLNSQAATTLVQLVSNPIIPQLLGKKRLFEIINEIFRMSGTNYNTRLEVGETEEDDIQDPTIAAEQARAAAGAQQAAAQPQPQPQQQNADEEFLRRLVSELRTQSDRINVIEQALGAPPPTNTPPTG